MSNKLKLVAIAILIIVIGSGSLSISGVFKPKKDSQLTLNSSSSISSISNSVVSTNSDQVSSKAISSVNQVVSSIQTVQYSSKAVEVVSSKIAQPTICNLADSPNLVKTNVGCFELIFDIGDSSIFKDPYAPKEVNYNKLYNSTENKNIIKKVATFYYSEVKDKLYSKNPQVWPTNSKKINNNQFEITISSIDKNYNTENGFNKSIYTRLPLTFMVDFNTNQINLKKD
jgi:hypothetical protein